MIKNIFFSYFYYLVVFGPFLRILLQDLRQLIRERITPIELDWKGGILIRRLIGKLLMVILTM